MVGISRQIQQLGVSERLCLIFTISMCLVTMVVVLGMSALHHSLPIDYIVNDTEYINQRTHTNSSV